MKLTKPSKLQLGLRFLTEMRLDSNVPLDAPIDQDIVIKVGVAALAMQPSWTDDEIYAVANINAEEAALNGVSPELNAALEEMFENIVYPEICQNVLGPIRNLLKKDIQ